MYVAMKDLEIRGAGNLLGGEQSGHIEGVGFDLYVRMVGEAVQQFKGEAPEEVVDVKVDLPVDAHLPHDYIGVGAAAAGDVPQGGRGEDGRAAGRGRGRDARPVRRRRPSRCATCSRWPGSGCSPARTG